MIYYSLCGLLVIIVLVCFCATSSNSTFSSVNIKANDGNIYTVRKGEENQEEAANILAKVIMTSNTIVKYMCGNKLPTSEIAYRLQYRWKNCKVREISSKEDTAAYVVNKGDEMRLCIRKTDGSFQGFNRIMFVVLHELAHMMSISYGHGSEFQDNFDAIIHVASSIGLYTPENFTTTTQDVFVVMPAARDLLLPMLSLSSLLQSAVVSG